MTVLLYCCPKHFPGAKPPADSTSSASRVFRVFAHATVADSLFLLYMYEQIYTERLNPSRRHAAHNNYNTGISDLARREDLQIVQAR